MLGTLGLSEEMGLCWLRRFRAQKHCVASRLDIRKYLKNLHPECLPWNVLPREVVTTANLAEFKQHLDIALRPME